MCIKKYIQKTGFLIAIIVITMTTASAQEKKAAPTSQELFNEIAHMDSVIFGAYNVQNLTDLKSYFTEDLEWYQDNGGLINYTTVFDNFGSIFKKGYNIQRQLVPGTLEVHPIKDFGAIETGSHQFKHIENGKEEVGTFKFLMIWKKVNDAWKISRVVSYDH